MWSYASCTGWTFDFLVVVGVLDQRNVENTPAIEDAVGNLLNSYLDELRAGREANEKGIDYWPRLPQGPGPNFRPGRSGPGAVRFWIDLGEAEALEIDINDTRQIKERLEHVLFKLYSAIEDWRGAPDRYGIPWGSFHYGRGWQYDPKKTPKAEVRETPEELQRLYGETSEPDPSWTKREAKALENKFAILSADNKKRSAKEAAQQERLALKELVQEAAKSPTFGKPYNGACTSPIRTADLLKESPRRRRGIVKPPEVDSDPRRSRFLPRSPLD